ncbi:Autophagy protein 7, partial [Coemansia erecta]
MSETLHFEAFSSTVEPEFWSGLAHHKLHSARLDTTRALVRGEFSGGRRHAVRGSNLGEAAQRLAVPARLRINQDISDTLQDSEQKQRPRRSGVVSVDGHLFNTNTIEEFKKYDKGELLRNTGAEILDAVRSGRATQDPELLWPFLLLSFADLKKYHFYHWFAFPAVTADPPDTVAEPPVPLKSLVARSSDMAYLLSELAGSSACLQGAFVARYYSSESARPWRIGSLSDWDEVCDDKLEDGGLPMIGFVDPSSHSTRPGWPLRNLLTWLRHCHPEVATARVLCFRDTALLAGRPVDSALLEEQCESIVLGVSVTPAASLADECQVSGWERNEKQRLVP